MTLGQLLDKLEPKTWVLINKGDPKRARTITRSMDYPVIRDREVTFIALENFYDDRDMYTSYVFIKIV